MDVSNHAALVRRHKGHRRTRLWPSLSLALGVVLAGAPADVPEAARPGRLLTSQARVLLTGVGQGNATLYGIPTGKGQLCGVYSSTYGTLGCAPQPRGGTPVVWGLGDIDAIGAGEPVFVEGFAPPDVESIQVRAGGATWTAQLRDGAFFVQMPRADVWPDSVLVIRNNRKPEEFPVHGPPLADRD